MGARLSILPLTNSCFATGITIHYGSYSYGRIDFAVLEARKFKNKDYGDSLLGDAQEEWLAEWCATNPTTAENDRIKIVLTQTPFASLSTYGTHWLGGMTEYSNGDFDSNGWPIEGRHRAMEILQNCTRLVLSGDQHVSVAASYDEYGITECSSPAVLNSVWWRLNRNPLGESYEDFFGNAYTLHAVWNVDLNVTKSFRMPLDTLEVDMSDETKELRADGYLMVNIRGDQAVCSAETYRASQRSIWEHAVSLV